MVLGAAGFGALALVGSWRGRGEPALVVMSMVTVAMLAVLVADWGFEVVDRAVAPWVYRGGSAILGSFCIHWWLGVGGGARRETQPGS